MKPSKQLNPMKSMIFRKPKPKQPIPDYVGKIGGFAGKHTQKLINSLADKAIKKKQGM